MGSQQSIAQSITRAKETDLSLNKRISLKLWLDEYGTDKGLQIPISNVAYFELKESMFTTLPYGQLIYVDDGTSREVNRFYSGRLVHIGFEYSSGYGESSDVSISRGTYRIAGSKTRTTSSGTVEYSVTLIYDALGLFNSVPRYPLLSIGESAKSTDVLASVCASCGLSMSTNVETSDDQQWFNPSMTGAEFITFVANHSFISERDFGMFWVAKDGKAHFDGIRASFESNSPYFFNTKISDKLSDRTKRVIFSDIYQSDLEKMTSEQLEDKYSNRCYILMTEDQKNNDGWSANFYGNSEDVSLYDPMLRTVDYDGSDLKIDWAHLTHRVKYQQISKGELASDSTNIDRSRGSVQRGYVNFDLHPAWDIATVQNKIMRSEFFANKHTFRLNTAKQLPCFSTQELRIGDILDIDYSQVGSVSTVDNGKFIVHSIDWYFQKGGDLYMDVRVSSDSVNPTASEKPKKS